MGELSLTYHGYVFDATGYGQAARANIHALNAAGVTLSVVDFSHGHRQVQDPLVMSLADRNGDGSDFHLFHGIPSNWGPQANRFRNVIAMTVWETDTMPSEWGDALNGVIEVWLPCEFNVVAFRRAIRTPIFLLPHPVTPRALNGDQVEPTTVVPASRFDFVFYSIFEWQDRKGPCEMLNAYFRAFTNDGDHMLLLKTNAGAAAIAAATVDRIRATTQSAARVVLVAQTWSEAQVHALHSRGDCYVSLHRGEGWAYPLFDAVTRGKPVIATGYSGPLDYLTPDVDRLVPFRLAPVRQPYIHYRPSMQWAEPDVEQAARLMRETYDNRGSSGPDYARRAAELRSSHSLAHIGALAKERLLGLLRQHNQPRWRQLRMDTLAPPTAPISGDWYDEDYFEHGLKSNWNSAYSWTAFGRLFQEAASYLTEMFPQASSYLEAGCAKGLLVRALREAGKECWGFDHSRWAINHADPAAEPFVWQASVDDETFRQDVDVLLAFDLLSQLTEEQARSFLRRSRQHSRMAIVAVITSFESDEDECRFQRTADDRDRSHVTMRQRRWWHSLFEETGWKLDALHKLGAERCQRHALPTRMGWKMYVYAP